MLRLLVLASAVLFACGDEVNQTRISLDEENDPLGVTHILMEDERGVLHFEDLTTTLAEEQTIANRVSPDDVHLYLYTRKNRFLGTRLSINNLNDLQNAKNYNPKKTNFFIAHGFLNNHLSRVNILIRDAVLSVEDVNVFVVDWSAYTFNLYGTAVKAVPTVGVLIGGYINKMMDHYKLQPQQYRIAGHSLGAHIAGCTGAAVKGMVDYIVGLDPARPGFSLSVTHNRLDESDAKFVQIIHTSQMYGIVSSIGHVDYYPNGGKLQPGCGLDFTGTCAHLRAFYYFAESVKNGGFSSKQCSGYEAYKLGLCEKNQQSKLGGYNLDTKVTGNFYLQTNSRSPFSKK